MAIALRLGPIPNPDPKPLELCTRLACTTEWQAWLQVKTSAVFLRDATMTTPYCLLLFGGRIFLEEKKNMIKVQKRPYGECGRNVAECRVYRTLFWPQPRPRPRPKSNSAQVDNWIKFKMDAKGANVIKNFRQVPSRVGKGAQGLAASALGCVQCPCPTVPVVMIMRL